MLHVNDVHMEAAMIKMTILLRRKPEMSHDDFVAYHRETHAPLFTSLPEVKQHVRRYVQCHSTGEQFPGMPEYHIDGSTELWFDDVAAAAAVFTAPDYLATIRPDEENFLDLARCEIFFGAEHEVIPASSEVISTKSSGRQGGSDARGMVAASPRGCS